MSNVSKRLSDWLSMYSNICKDIIIPWLETSPSYRSLSYVDLYEYYGPLRKLAPLIKRYQGHVKWEADVSLRFTKLSDGHFDTPFMMPELLEESLVLMETIDEKKLRDYVKRCIELAGMVPLSLKLAGMTALMVALSPFQILVSYGTTADCVKKGVPMDVVASGFYDFITNFGYVSLLKYVVNVLDDTEIISEKIYTDVSKEATITMGINLVKAFQDIYFSETETIV